MRGKLFYTLSLMILSYNISFSQDKIREIEKSDWAKITSYVAAKITNLYIQEYLGKQPKGSKINVEEDSYSEFKEELANNTIGHPINPDTLQNFLDPHFSVTNTRLTSRMLGWNNLESRDLNIFFDSLSNLLVERKSDIQNNSEFDALKTEVRAKYDSEAKEVKQETSIPNGDPNSENPDQGNLWKNIMLFQILSVVFFLTTITFLLIWLDIRSKFREKKDEVDEVRKLEKRENQHNSPQLQLQTNSTKYRNPSRQKVERTQENKTPGSVQASKAPETVQKKGPSKENSEQINHIPPTPTVVELTTKVFYAGKPTPHREFQDMKDSKEDNHIYKLTILDEINAEFELVDLSGYMKTEVVNSPDEYLYRVCHHENNNTEYTSDILTIKKGTANKIDGMWQVKEDNKAIIKFQ